MGTAMFQSTILSNEIAQNRYDVNTSPHQEAIRSGQVFGVSRGFRARVAYRSRRRGPAEQCWDRSSSISGGRIDQLLRDSLPGIL